MVNISLTLYFQCEFQIQINATIVAAVGSYVSLVSNKTRLKTQFRHVIYGLRAKNEKKKKMQGKNRRQQQRKNH